MECTFQILGLFTSWLPKYEFASLLPPSDKVVSSRLDSGNWLLMVNASSHVASSDCPSFHWINHCSHSLPCFFTVLVAKIATGVIMSLGCKSNSRGKMVLVGPYMAFFNKETWKTGWILDVGRRSNLYATRPILVVIWKGPKKRASNFGWIRLATNICL